MVFSFARPRRRFARAAVLAVAIVTWAPHLVVADAAPSPSATAVPVADQNRIVPLPLPTACALDLGLSLEDALGRPIADATDRAFVLAVRRRSTGDLVAASRHPIASELAGRVNDALAKTCTGSSASVIATRAFVVAAATHTVGLNDAGENSLLIALGYAAAALSARAELSEQDVDAAMAPFGTTVTALTTPPPIVACKSERVLAKMADLVNPAFPDLALKADAFSTVRITVHLDTDGIALYVRPYAETRGSSDPLVQAVLIAAAASLCDVATDSCRPQPSNYLYVAKL